MVDRLGRDFAKAKEIHGLKALPVKGQLHHRNRIYIDHRLPGIGHNVGNSFGAEGAGENLFVVKDGQIYEPEIASALVGITRATVIQLAKELGYEVKAKRLTRDDLNKLISTNIHNPDLLSIDLVDEHSS